MTSISRATTMSRVTTSAPHQALYRRWRAQTFSEIVGQQAVVVTLRNAVRTNAVAHGLLFVGVTQSDERVGRGPRRHGSL